MDINSQKELEKKIMEMLLTNEHSVAKILKHQYEHSEIKSRKFSGAGFFTKFKIENGIDVAPKKNFEIGGVSADVGDNKGVLGFLLFIRDGYLDWLEGYTMGIDFWPDIYKDVVLKFDDPKGITDYQEKF
jgi:hypothetical protein